MKFYLGLLVGSAIFIAVTRARSSGRDEPVQELQTRNLDVVDQPVNGQDEKQQSAYYSDGSEQEYHDMYGDIQGLKRNQKPLKKTTKSIAAGQRKMKRKPLKKTNRHTMILRPKPALIRKTTRNNIAAGRHKMTVRKQKPLKKTNRNQIAHRMLNSRKRKPPAAAPVNSRQRKRPNSAAGRCHMGLQVRPPKSQKPRNRLGSRCEKVKVHTLPVGQGDCAVVYCHTGHAVLFDCGANQKNHFMQPRNDGISYLQSFFSLSEVKSITVMISHGDLDHYNLIPKLFDFNTDTGKELINKITEVIVGGPLADYQAKDELIITWLTNIKITNSVSDISGNCHEMKDICGDQDIVFEIVTRTAQKKTTKNERGMVMKLSCKSCGSLLFAGDMEGDVATEMVKYNSPFLSATHYKMAHHGASTKANQMNWLQAILPDEVHVSHIYNGQYSHPRCDALDRVMELTSLGVTASAHELHCFNGRNGPRGPVEHDIRQRIYSTAPTSDKICTISLTFTDKGAETEYNCYPESVRVMPNKASSNDFPTC